MLQDLAHREINEVHVGAGHKLNPRLSISRKTAIVNPSGEPRVLGISNGYH